MRQLLLLLLVCLTLTGCLEDRCSDTRTYVRYEPVILTAAEWRSNSFTPQPAGVVCDPSGFYVYGDLLFVLDRSQGLHIIDNSDNANPQPLKFIGIPGGEGIAVRNGVLYVNQYVDLLAFDLSDPAAPQFLSRTENVFDAQSNFATDIQGNGDVIVEYVMTEETVEVSCEQPQFTTLEHTTDGFHYRAQTNNFNNGGMPDRVGAGGSLARFTISQGNLYAVDERTLRVFSLADPTAPAFAGTTDLGRGIETIFPYKNMLFIGANDGMHIYSVADPLSPDFLSTFEHVRSCDPVVVQNDIAYVTMWGGSGCGGSTDQLMVVDVATPTSPKLMQELRMSNSHGLGVAKDHLFLCSGPEGLKVFDLESDGRVGDRVHQAGNFPAKDVIVLPRQRKLIVLGWEGAGIRQFDYAADGEPILAGEIARCND